MHTRDNQAFGRIHRIGQTKVTHFLKAAIGEASIDDKFLKCKISWFLLPGESANSPIVQVKKEIDIGTVFQDTLTPQQWKDLVQLPGELGPVVSVILTNLYSESSFDGFMDGFDAYSKKIDEERGIPAEDATL